MTSPILNGIGLQFSLIWYNFGMGKEGEVGRTSPTIRERVGDMLSGAAGIFDFSGSLRPISPYEGFKSKRG